MADFGISIVEKLIEVIGSEVIKEICYRWGYKSELEKLEKTIITIKAVLVDAEAKRDLSMVQQGYISDLKAAVYDADDLFDEFFTLAKLNEIDGNRGGKFSDKVRRFFSSNKNKFSQAKQMSRRVKEIRKQLDAIADDYNKFGLSINYTPIVRRREETCSYVDVKYIIGRDSDKKAILDVLLDPSASNDFCLLSIVGVGGLGKTALAQLVYQDIKNIQNGFLSLWVCVSDQDGGQFDVKTILCKILKLVNVKLDSDPSMEEVTNEFQEKFREIKYFLVLDDLWNEDRGKWIELENFLRMGQGGSKVVVTTRSEKTASSIGSKYVHKLKGLSEEDSWCLFEMTAFGEGEKDEELVEIGENIVKKCGNIPLAIKVMGSLLHGQERSKWESIEKSDLGEIKEGSDHILHTLKLSYYNLTPSLKSCFSYCAIFSKDEEIDRELLIGLWLAQGYIVPLDGGQSLEDAAEEYFLILLRRCFFQDVKKNEYGDIESVKMHDLIHDIAQEVSKEEICVVNSKTKNVGEKVRHLIDDSKYEKHIVCSAKIRSYISYFGMADKEVENMTALRTLVVGSPVESRLILSSWHMFLLLRYVYLCDDKLLALPDSFTKLYNLQTLILNCWQLKELPKDFGNLINLRHLVITGCDEWMGMPLGMDKCTNLRILPCFVAGNGNSNAKLNILQFLNKIKGGIDILIRENYVHVDEVSDTEGGYLKDMKHLTKLNIKFEGECINPEGIMKNLQPPSNLKSLKLLSYNGKTIQWFVISPQHHLVDIEIRNCGKLEQIPVLSKLPLLKSLILFDINSVEYMEEGMSNSSVDTIEVVDFFPSLESLQIGWMKELKGWWKEGGMRLRFPRLSSLNIFSCPNFSSFVPYLSSENLPEHQCPSLCTLFIKRCPKFASNLVCPSLEKLDLGTINERLLITCENYQVDMITKPRDISIRDKVSRLKSLRLNGVTTLTLLYCSDSEVESFVGFKEDLNQICASSLQTLKIEGCDNLRRLSGLESLTALQELSLNYNHNLSINEDDEEPWKSFHSLCKLTFGAIPKMKNLPKGMQHLTSLQFLQLFKCGYLEGLPQWISCLSSLQSLVIHYCERIKSFPEAMKDLTSLNSLSIKACPDLEEICKNPDGEDFQKIKHIPNISINICFL